MKVWILILVLHNVVPYPNGPAQPETDVYIGTYATSAACEHNIQVFRNSIPPPASTGLELHCAEQPVLTR